MISNAPSIGLTLADGAADFLVSEKTPTDRAGSVLLVDDEPAIVKVLSRILERFGYDVTTALDGRQALERLRSGQRFDVVVSDINMPGADGLCVLQMVRGGDLDLPVVLLTGSPDLSSAVKAVEYGAFRYLIKPAQPEALLEVVDRAVQWHRLALVRREAAAEIARVPKQKDNGLYGHFRAALENLWIATQPIVSWSAKTVFGYEALVRTDEPTLRSPVDFFGAAERLGETTKLSHAIRLRVAESIGKLPPSCPMFVNVHPLDMEDPDLLSEYGILSPFADQVVLEITERVGLEQIGALGPRLKRLRDLGYRIALDDLGAGYAGLSSLAQLEPDVVKVDMSLVRGIERSSIKQKLVRVVGSLCRDLGVLMVVEGVETHAERDCIVSLGGDLFQGYLFARPGKGFPTVEY
jgi:EAL domain-containing protein (putative c-di-GMP-specific phosphodiesterase class I)/CheY-like chemotaxis protein